MASLTPFIRRRFLSSSSSTTTTNVSKKWAVKEVTKSNFSESLEEFKDHLSSSDFVAVSLQKTGSYRAPWHRPQPFDTADTSYCKAKYAAERFQLLQFAACPFTLRASKLTPYPYNFVLFPRDELKMGMPTYSFSVQTSHLTSMAEEGFDFTACIYNVAMLVSPHLSFLAQERGLDSADLISFLAYNINTLNERQKNVVKDLADLGLIKLQQGFVEVETNFRLYAYSISKLHCEILCLFLAAFPF